MKKFILTCLLTLSSVVAFAFSGSGTEADPYKIYTAEDLYLIRNTPEAYYQLQNDIDLTQWITNNYPEKGWMPICSSSTPFKGTLDGNGYTISELFINRTTDYNGLFGYATNAKFKNIDIICKIQGGHETAAIAGYGSNVTISNCHVKGSITGKDKTGGLVGEARILNATDCSFVGTIKGADSSGGISGAGYALTLTQCSIIGDLSGGSRIGGLVGMLEESHRDASGIYYSTNIIRCYVKGNVTSLGSYAGGLLGEDSSSYSYAYYSYSSSIISYRASSKITDCIYIGDVSASENYVGGLCGYASGEYRRCLVNGTVTGKNYIGGLAGFLKGTYASCYDYNSNKHEYQADAIIHSCVSLCTALNASGSSISRGCNVGSYWQLGTLGTTTENKTFSNCQVSIGEELLKIEDSPTNGYGTTEYALQHAASYSTIGWDFENVWDIDEGKGFPCLRFSQSTESDMLEHVSFDFTNPAELYPKVNPNSDEDSGVNVTNNSFASNRVDLSFGLGTRTQTFSARLWTNEDLSYGLRLYQNGTMTISTSSDNMITKISFNGEDISSMSADAGNVSNGVWTGEANSVTFTIGASCNKINTITVDIKHDILALTDVAPAVMKGTYEPGKVKYSRVSGGDYASFCLPFDIDLSEATGIETVYMPMEQIVYNTETEWLMMFLDEQDMTSTVKAGTPFLAKTFGSEVTFSNSKRVGFSQPISENPVAKALKVFNFDGKSGVLYKNNTLGVTWGGTYVPTEATEGMNSFNINGSFGQHTGTLNAYRAYVMQTTSGASHVRGIQLNLGNDEDVVTSVFQLLNEPAATDGIYDMQGRRVLNAQQGGLYIINGKKVVK